MEIIGQNYVSPPNVLPFLGASETLLLFRDIDPWLPNGTIIEYIRENDGVDPLELVNPSLYYPQ